MMRMATKAMWTAAAALGLALGGCGVDRDEGVGAPPPEQTGAVDPENRFDEENRFDDPFGAEETETGRMAGTEQRDQTAQQDPQAEQDARDLVQEATRVVERMQRDPEMSDLLQRAEGVFIVPEYGKAAAVVGARGGEGVLLARREQGWSAPVFYDIGAISLGAQLGATGGDIAMVLLSEEALQSFEQNQNFSLNADAGLTLVDFSAQGQASAGKGDVVMWSDTEGAFAGVSLSVTDIAFDEEDNRAFYGQQAADSPEQLMDQQPENRYAEGLRQQLEEG